MNILMQLAIIFTICWLGQVLSALLPFTFPASVLSMIMVFILLYSGALKIYHIKKQANFLLDNMAFFFIPPAVAIIDTMDIILPNLLSIVFICMISTISTFFITAYAVRLALTLEKKWFH